MRTERNKMYWELLAEFNVTNRDEKVFLGWLTKRLQPELGAFIKNIMLKQPNSFKTKEEKIRAIFNIYRKERKVVYDYINGNTSTPAATKSAEIDMKKLQEDIRKIVLEEGYAVSKGMEAMIKEAIDREAKVVNKVEIHVKKAGTKTKVLKDAVLPSYFQHLVNLATSRANIMLVGPTGCGKTHIVNLLAQTLGLKYSSISCSVGMTESKLEGWLLPTGTGGKFEYLKSQFVDMYENGGIFLLDEIDASDANTLVFINQAIAQDHFFLPKRFNKPLVKKHKDFVLVAAANTFGHGADMMFVGRNQLDAATLDRFRTGMVMVDYDETVEKKLVDPEVYDWAINIRNRINTHKVRRAMSTRTMIDFSKLKADHGYGKEQWEQSYFADWSKDDRNRVML